MNEKLLVETTPLEDGIKKTYAWFLENIENIKEVKL